MDETRGDGLTMEGARGVLAANEQLMNKFEEMVDCRSRVEDRTELSAAPESTTNMMTSGDTAEQRTLQEYIVAQGSELHAGRGAPELLDKAAEAYRGIQENPSARAP